jgi:hypothetical protein
MANQISYTFSATVTFGNLSDTIQNTSITVPLSAVGKSDNVVSVPTSAQELTINVTTLGWAYIQNLDGTNYVTMALHSASPFLKLKAGEAAWVRLVPGSAYDLQANTAAVNVRVIVYDD